MSKLNRYRVEVNTIVFVSAKNKKEAMKKAKDILWWKSPLVNGYIKTLKAEIERLPF